jgi:hypothetical protein
MLNMVFGNLFAAFFYMYVDTNTENTIGIISAPNFYLFLIFLIVAIIGTAGFIFLKNPRKVTDKGLFFLAVVFRYIFHPIMMIMMIMIIIIMIIMIIIIMIIMMIMIIIFNLQVIIIFLF